MATINIRRDVTDQFYRYKMERLQSKIEGKGNGIKTVIVNLSSVAQSLARPASYVIKYFGFELGAQTTTNPSDDRWIINGAHEAAKLQDYLDGFITKFVLCKKCKNPETDIVIKDGLMSLDCKACGERSSVDPRLKLVSFILKNQPKKGKKDKSAKKTRRQKEAEDKANGNGHADGSPGDSHEENGDDDGDDDVGVDGGSDDELTKRIKAEAKEIDQPSKIKDEEWASEFSKEALKARHEGLTADLQRSLVLGEDDDEDGDGEGGNSPYDQLGSWILAQAEEKKGVANVVDVEIYKEAKDLGIETKHRTLQVLAQTLFDENIVKQIPKRAPMLKKMITSDRHEKAFLGGTERFVGKDHPDLIPQIPAILMAFYQEDLVSEEVFTKWGTRASKKYVDIATSKKVRKAAEKFIEWLQNAESDEEDSD